MSLPTTTTTAYTRTVVGYADDSPSAAEVAGAVAVAASWAWVVGPSQIVLARPTTPADRASLASALAVLDRAAPGHLGAAVVRFTPQHRGRPPAQIQPPVAATDWPTLLRAAARAEVARIAAAAAATAPAAVAYWRAYAAREGLTDLLITDLGAPSLETQIRDLEAQAAKRQTQRSAANSGGQLR